MKTIKATSVAIALLSATIAAAQSTQSIFPLMPPSVSTIPSNGDLNPYGIAFAPANLPVGPGLQAGDILVTNFNNSNNLQGTGTTIVRITKGGQVSTFFTAPQQFSGLSAAIGILSDGLVFVGCLPTLDGTSATARLGRLAVLDRVGDFLGTFGTPTSINGPWAMAVHDIGNGVTGSAKIWVSNVLSGSISRFDIGYNAGDVTASVLTLASGFSHRGDPAALELGPSGLAYDAVHDKLFVASSTDNAIYEIATAATANSPVSAMLFLSDYTHLHGPLDMAFLPNGHLLVANSDGSNVDPNQPSEIEEYSATGAFIGQTSIDPNNGGAFGVAVNNVGWGTFQLATVDDNKNTLNITTAVAK